MDIWTEQLERRHLPTLERWVGRAFGAVTPNDLPADAEKLAWWFEMCTAEPGRLDFLISVYETPVGISGFRHRNGRDDTAELYLLLCETNYNPLRTATYAALQMLGRAFLDYGVNRVTARVYARHGQVLDALERMGFFRTSEQDGLICLAVEKNAFLRRKYLF